MIDLTHYTPQHRGELEALLASRKWQEALSSGLVEVVQADKIKPGKPRPFIDTVVEQLLEFNRENVHNLIAQGHTDADELFDALSRWPDNLAGKDPKLSFLGLNLTSTCNFIPRCIYCNQERIEAPIGYSKVFTMSSWLVILLAHPIQPFIPTVC